MSICAIHHQGHKIQADLCAEYDVHASAVVRRIRLGIFPNFDGKIGRTNYWTAKTYARIKRLIKKYPFKEGTVSPRNSRTAGKPTPVMMTYMIDGKEVGERKFTDRRSAEIRAGRNEADIVSTVMTPHKTGWTAVLTLTTKGTK